MDLIASDKPVKELAPELTLTPRFVHGHHHAGSFYIHDEEYRSVYGNQYNHQSCRLKENL